MGLFGIGRKAIAVEMAGRNLTAIMMDADDCWHDVCGLRAYKTSGPIATCEVAFARAALVQSLLIDACSPEQSERALKASNEMIIESFSDQDTPDTFKHYSKSLIVAAVERVAMYLENAFPTSQLAAVLGAALGVPGIPSVEAVYIFESVEARVSAQLKKAKLI